MKALPIFWADDPPTPTPGGGVVLGEGLPDINLIKKISKDPIYVLELNFDTSLTQISEKIRDFDY